MAKVKTAKDFISAKITDMPKNVGFLAQMGDGAYLCIQRFEVRERDRYSNPGSKGRLKFVIQEGELIVSTEGGHLYRFNGKDGFKGFGKNIAGMANAGQMLVQRVALNIEVSEYTPPSKKKVTKKKVAKKKTAKKRR